MVVSQTHNLNICLLNSGGYFHWIILRFFDQQTYSTCQMKWWQWNSSLNAALRHAETCKESQLIKAWPLLSHFLTLTAAISVMLSIWVGTCMQLQLLNMHDGLEGLVDIYCCFFWKLLTIKDISRLRRTVLQQVIDSLFALVFHKNREVQR